MFVHLTVGMVFGTWICSKYTNYSRTTFSNIFLLLCGFGFVWHINGNDGALKGILNHCPIVLPQANLKQPWRCSVSNDIGILLAGCARRWPPALWWDLPLICHGRWLLPAPRSHRAQFEPFQKPGPNPLPEMYLGSRERRERRASRSGVTPACR